MGAHKYIITVESDIPPQILLGQNLGGAIVTKLEQEKLELVSAADLAIKYNLSVDTIRRKLVAINQGTEGKALYNPIQADSLLKDRTKRVGRKRAN
ncbi:HTH domain protein [Acinetobacter genomosp. 33YU]|uniref:DNA-binding protein n=1 Tax=Acinetobacter genomosp. 33YU TaxID=1675530 RepID=UPI00097F931D|nr:DNA-binding protein [Acinetobacter genomosp. 33YU]ONN50386.1 HTH domain protein [Acinetobacter genomosp. 33YU]